MVVAGGCVTVISGGEGLSEDLFSPVWEFTMNFVMLASERACCWKPGETWKACECLAPLPGWVRV